MILQPTEKSRSLYKVSYASPYWNKGGASIIIKPSTNHLMFESSSYNHKILGPTEKSRSLYKVKPLASPYWNKGGFSKIIQ
jgi:hypothetical protein